MELDHRATERDDEDREDRHDGGSVQSPGEVVPEPDRHAESQRRKIFEGNQP